MILLLTSKRLAKGHTAEKLPECQDMTAHHKHKKQNLRRPKHLPPDASKHDLARISHVVYMRISQLKLPDNIAGIGCQDTEAGNKQNAAKRL